MGGWPVKPTLGLDLDGVIVDFGKLWMDKWNAEFGTDYTPDMVTHWEWRKGQADLQKESFWKWAERAQLWKGDVPTYPGQLEAARKLHKRYEVVILSSKPEWARDYVNDWLRGSGIKPTGVIYTGPKNKAQFAMDAYVDDAPHNLRDFMYQQAFSKVYRMVRKWNYSMGGVISINSLEQLP
jgi:5'(3')-deoxyribonucleotidase